MTTPGTVVIVLTQADVRGSGEKLAAISIEIYSNQGKRVQRGRTGKLVASNAESYIFRREVSVETDLAAGAYTVLLSTFNQGKETTFTAAVFQKGNSPVDFKVAAPV